MCAFFIYCKPFNLEHLLKKNHKWFQQLFHLLSTYLQVPSVITSFEVHAFVICKFIVGYIGVLVFNSNVICLRV
jgi:hypothetical protein